MEGLAIRDAVACSRVIVDGNICRAAMLPKALAKETFSLTNVFLEPSRIEMPEECKECGTPSYTLSAARFDRLHYDWENVHSYGCRAAKKGNNSISRNGTKEIKPEKRRRYLGSYLLEVGYINSLNQMDILKKSVVSVKDAPHVGLEEHANICLTFEEGTTLEDMDNDALALSRVLLEHGAKVDCRPHICAEDKEYEGELKKFILIGCK